MTEDATINGKPLKTWGARLLSGTNEALLAPPSMKDYIRNESRLEHGEHVMTGNAKFASREVSIPVMIEGSSRTDYIKKYMSFVEELRNGNVALYVPDLGKTYSLAYLSCGKYGSFGECRSKLMIKFLESEPWMNNYRLNYD